MKKSILAIALLGISSIAFSQKGEVRKADRALDDQDFSEAISLLNDAKSSGILDENDKWKEKYYLAKGKAYGLKASANPSNFMEDINTSIGALEKVLEMDSDNEEAKQGITQMRRGMIEVAIQNQEQEKFDTAEKLLYKAYEMNKADTTMLYYAASAAVNGELYDKALKHYTKLLDMNFDGSSIQYTAVNKETGKEEVFQNKDMRDISLKSGDYINPNQNKTPPLTGEIAKNITLIYIQEDEPEKALKAIEKAKEENPEDIDLMQAEADLYYRIGQIDKYNAVMKEVVKKDPENPSLYYNLGVSSEQLGDLEGAREYYQKAIKLDSDMVDAYVNMASITLAKEREIVDEMNKLGNSPADNKKYQELSKEKKKYYVKALPYLEKTTELDPENLGALQTMLNIYYQIGEDEKAKATKAKI
ncbi:MAG: tetratricopeptide repeat protein, partial [Psychroflexus sp.]